MPKMTKKRDSDIENLLTQSTTQSALTSVDYTDSLSDEEIRTQFKILLVENANLTTNISLL